MKNCNKCGNIYDLEMFHRDKTQKDGHSSICKTCKKEYMSQRWKTDEEYRNKRKEYHKSRSEYYTEYMRKKRLDPEFRQKHKEYMANYWSNKNAYEYHKSLVLKNPEYNNRLKEKRNIYNQTENAKISQAKYRAKRLNDEKYKKYKNSYEKNRRDNSIDYKIYISIKNRISKLLRGKKSKTIESLLGCNKDFYIRYIQSKFTNKMTWENYGSYWHIDHIVPCNFFNLDDEKNKMIAFNYRNTQPLEASLNCSKQDNLPVNYLEIINEIKKALDIQGLLDCSKIKNQ